MYVEPKHREISIEAATLISEGKLIDAIKLVRVSGDLSLKEAKRRVDAYLEREPLLKAQLQAQRSASRRKLFLGFLVIDLLIVAAVICWLKYSGAV